MAHVAILVGPDFEDSEYTQPRACLEEAGHSVTVIGREAGEELQGKQGDDVALVDAHVNEVDVEALDALVIPGGFGPDQLRTDGDVVDFVRAFGETEKPIAAVCHGPQLLIEAELVKGRRLTSWGSVRTDLQNAGAQWVDEEVVEDGPLITSRQPDDLPAFSSTLLARLG